MYPSNTFYLMFLLLGPVLFLKAHAAPLVSLPAVVKYTINAYFDQEGNTAEITSSVSKQFPVTPPFHRPTGVFVTLSKNGNTRACWGSIYPKDPNAIQGTVSATLGALTKEYRYPPVKRSEIQDLKPQVTLIEGLQQIRSISGLNPFRDGLLVRAGNRNGVILPGEAVSAHHQWVMARLKAGISAQEPQQLYRLSVRVYQ